MTLLNRLSFTKVLLLAGVLAIGFTVAQATSIRAHEEFGSCCGGKGQDSSNGGGADGTDCTWAIRPKTTCAFQGTCAPYACCVGMCIPDPGLAH